MRIVHTIDEVRQVVAEAKHAGKRVGFVPTLGGLHEGHGNLIRRSVSECDVTVVSIFVNALQFGPNEDFQKYPRTLDKDAALCQEWGVDVIFAPSHEEMYPQKQLAYVDVEELTDGLCGPFRPGHFRGVATVVLKLFLIVLPDVAYFGEKDGQQLAVVRRMVEDLNVPVEIRSVPTVREPDGLAMSTRNQYLNPDERRAATAIYRGLQAAQERMASGEKDAAVIQDVVRSAIAQEPLLKEEYIEVVDAKTLRPVSLIDEPVMVAVAVRCGAARLIDNIVYPSSN